MKLDPEMPIEKVLISNRAIRALQDRGIKKAGEVTRGDVAEVKRSFKVGDKTWREIMMVFFPRSYMAEQKRQEDFVRTRQLTTLAKLVEKYPDEATRMLLGEEV